MNGPEVASVPPIAEQKSAHGLVLRNAAFLVIAQLFGMPLSLAVNTAMARYLGPQDFGNIYLATTFASLGFLLVDWGQISTLPAAVAHDRSRAGEFLGTGLAWRVTAAVVVYVVLATGVRLAGYNTAFQVALALVVIGSAIAAVNSSFQDTIRGFERTDIGALGLVGQNFLTALFIIPTLFLGGRLRAALTAQALAYAIVATFVFRALRSMRIGPLSFQRSALRALLRDGRPFLLLGLVNVLQPNIDAVFLSKLSPAETLGWFAAARKLIGVLVFPAASLVAALYPTLCRLYVEDLGAYRRTVTGALRTATVIVTPIAIGTALYADTAIRLFNRQTFAPAEDDLRLLAPFVFLLYFTMILGASLAAAQRQRGWAITQFGCVAISVIVDPLLIPWFQRHTGNGGLGVCIATLLSEVLMVGVGFYLAPRGLIDRPLMKGLGLAFAAGAAMAAVARVLSGLSPFLAAPVAVAAYGSCLWFIGGLDKEQLDSIRGIVARKAGRNRSPAEEGRP